MSGLPGRESANSLLAFGSQLKSFFLGKQSASQGCAGCTLHIPRMCHSIDIIDLHIFMTIFQQLVVKCFEERQLALLIHKMVPHGLAVILLRSLS